MRKAITIHNAKANLSKLVKQAQAGKAIYIGVFGKPETVLAPQPSPLKISLGVWQGLHTISYADADLLNSDVQLADQMTKSPLYSDER